MRYWIHIFSLALLFIALSSCTSIRLDEDLSDYSSEIARLERTLGSDPQNQDALRDLGAIYVRTGNPLEGNRYLQDGYALGSRDPKLLFYLGLANERLGKRDTAIRVYESFTDVPRNNPYRRLMSGRWSSLNREIAREEIRGRMAVDDSLGIQDVVSNAVAVFALEYRGENESYANIGRGLAEWMTLDLIKVSGLSVLERVRLQALLDELDLAKSGAVDPSTAPRAGRLLRAGRVVGGTYNVLSDNSLQVVPAYVETNTAAVETLPDQSDDLENFFLLEKRIVFALLNDLGIQLSEAEQDAIDEVPTRNLQAFLAYSRGLAAEDQQDFGAAADFFGQAIQIDPGFEIASVEGETAEGMSETFGSVDNALSSARQLEPLTGSAIDPLSDRLTNLGISIEAPVVPGTDARKPAVEGTMSSPDLLPDPPPPPIRN